ncbi:hypothetical protein ABRZ03_05020 [Castellaniella ginsengisoli]|uniref:DUF3592 domain-containing protein n=1 Tax=Castellaniella ginsengisoli TaxID=546114 RepID=A0AB39E2W5_9BURK
MADSAKSHGYAVAAAWASFPTLGIVGEASKEREGQARGGEAAASPKLRHANNCGTAWLTRFGCILGVLVVVLSIFGYDTEAYMQVKTRISVATTRLVTIEHPQLSLQVALHVTKRQNGANASNRGGVSGGITGMADSAKSHGYAVAASPHGCWSEGFNTSRSPEHGA